MQNAKDTFYELLRTRLAAVNPQRTIRLRGVVRPGVLVEENELLTTTALPDCFRVRWSVVGVDAKGALPQVTLQCAIDYETAGTAIHGGMDRGRSLAAMDAELAAIVNAAPRTVVKTSYAGLAVGNAAVTMQTNLWWGNVIFGKTVVKDDRLARTATVDVMAYQEDGEL